MQFDENNPPSWRKIVEITGVSERTARRYLKHGAPAHVVRLVELTRRGRIVPDNWPEYFRFNHRDLFETGSHQPAVNWQQLTWLHYIVSCWYDALQAIQDAQLCIDYLRERLPRAEMIKLEAHRDRLREIERRRRVSVAEAVQRATQGTA